MRGSIALIVSLVCAAALAGLIGCARERRGAIAAPATQRAVTVVGRPLILPVELLGRLDPSPRVRLDDGRDALARVVWISSTPEPADPGWRWIAPAGRWSATPADAAARPSSAGFWAAVIELPVDAVGQGVWLAGRRVELDWLPDPTLVAPAGEQMIWTSPLDPATRSSPLFARLAAEEARDPFRRWRWRLAFEGLAPGATPDEKSFQDPVIEALASGLEARWQVGLAWLWREDPELAGVVKRQLVQVARDGSRGSIPAWSSDAPALDSLLADLTNPRLDGPRRAERARAWADAQPTLAAWVVDDAGVRDGSSGVGLPTIALANLADAPVVAVCTWTGAPGAPEMARVEAGDIERATLPLDNPIGPRRLHIDAGQTSLELAAAGPMSAAPPGLAAAPFFADWSMPEWLAGVPARSTDTIARLYAEPDPTLGEAWTLYVECRAARDPAGELVRLWLGPVGHHASIIRADADGDVRDERANTPIPGAIVHRRGDRWTALIPIPNHAIETDRTLRLAIERIDASSRRTCWPRPLLPWQSEPGRALVDLSAWNTRLGRRGHAPSPDR